MKNLSIKSTGIIGVYCLLLASSAVQADTNSTAQRHNETRHDSIWSGTTVINAGSGLTVRNYPSDYSSRQTRRYLNDWQHNRTRHDNRHQSRHDRRHHTPPGRSYHQNNYGRNYYSYSTGGLSISYDDSPYRNDRHHYEQPSRNERHQNTFLKDRFGNCYEVVHRHGRETRNRVPRSRCRF